MAKRRSSTMGIHGRRVALGPLRSATAPRSRTTERIDEPRVREVIDGSEMREMGPRMRAHTHACTSYHVMSFLVMCSDFQNLCCSTWIIFFSMQKQLQV